MPRTIRIILIQAVIVLVAASFALAQHAPGQKPKLELGSPAPGFTLKDSTGKEWKLADLKGKKVVLLDFGATNCIPCRSTAKGLEELNRKYKGKSLQIFTVCLNGPYRAELVPSFIKEMDLSFPFLLDLEFKVAQDYFVETIPYLVLVNLEGRVIYTHLGYDPDMVKKLSKEIDLFLPNDKPQAAQKKKSR